MTVNEYLCKIIVTHCTPINLLKQTIVSGYFEYFKIIKIQMYYKRDVFVLNVNATFLINLHILLVFMINLTLK